MTREDLIARLEAATEGSRELDEDIWEVKQGRCPSYREICDEAIPYYTRSIDDALTLTDGLHWMIKTCEHNGMRSFVAEVDSKPYPMSAACRSAPLAMCAAALKASSPQRAESYARDDPESDLVRLARPPAPNGNGTTVGAQPVARYPAPNPSTSAQEEPHG